MLRFLLPSLLFASSLAAQELPAGAFARLGGTALRHPERPLALAFRAGTSELASLGSDGTVRIWDTKTGKELLTLRQKDLHANGMAFSANGAFLAVHFGEKELWIYDAAKKYEKSNILRRMRLFDGITVSDDAQIVAGMCNGNPELVQIPIDLTNLELPPAVAVAAAPNGKSVALVQKDDGDSYSDILEVPSGKRMLKVLRKGAPNMNRIAYAPDSRTLAMASDTAAPIIVFQLGKEEPLAKIEGTGPVAFANADTLIGRKNGKLALWNTEGKLLHENIGKDVNAYAVNGDGKLAATDSGSTLGSPRIRLWNVASGGESILGEEPLTELIGILSDPKRGVLAKTLGAEKHWIPAPIGSEKPNDTATGMYRLHARSKNGEIVVTVETGSPNDPHTDLGSDKDRIIKLPTAALGVAVHPEGKSFAAILRDGTVRVWDDTGKELWSTRVIRSLRGGIAYSPNGKTIAVTSIIRVAMFNAADGKEAGTIDRQWEDGPFTSVCFNHDGSLIAAGTQGSAGSGNVYEVASLGLVKRCEGNCGSVIGVAFSAKSDVLVTAHSDDSLLAWKPVEAPKASLTLEKQCEALSNAEASVAWPAMMALVEAKEKGVNAIAEGLKKPTKNEVLRNSRAAVVLTRIGSAEAKKVLAGMKE